MSKRKTDPPDCRLRIDPILVDKFSRIQGGINEIGKRIVRDIGLKYDYDKHTGTLDIIGQDADILVIAVETLRFWVEDNDFPTTGVTCQVGYPNRGLVIWRFHGDYAKKFHHLFGEEIAHLKEVPSVNIKAVPNKCHLEYVELFCHFSAYQKIKDEVKRITEEIAKVFQDDFFIPSSDRVKAKKFANGNSKDEKVLYALKDYPEGKVRVLMFARNREDVARARKDWMKNIQILTRESEFVEVNKGPSSELKSVSYLDENGSSVFSERIATIIRETPARQADQTNINTMKGLTHSRSSLNKGNKDLKVGPFNVDTSPRGPKIDNSNFPRPHDFVYPVQKVGPPLSPILDPPQQPPSDPEHEDVFVRSVLEQDGFTNSLINGEFSGNARWITDNDNLSLKSKRSTTLSNRIYVHHQISKQDDNEQLSANVPFSKAVTNKQRTGGKETVGEESTRNINKQSKHSLRSNYIKSKAATKPQTQPAQSKLKPRKKTNPKPVLKPQRRPRTNKSLPNPQVLKYHINVSGLNIYLYKDNIVTLQGMDALVNVVMNDLKTGDEVASDLFKLAGKQVIDEIDVHLNTNGEVETSETIVTSAGKLSVFGIIHVVSPVWKRYTVWEECATDLHKAIYNCLKTAESHKYRKITIPTIGSEPAFGIPKDLVAEVYVKALIDYSMGMGPMYPVLEIHLVDMDAEMLKYIKDAYESWVATPGMADDINKHIKTDSGRPMRQLQSVSDRTKSAVNLQELPSHRSENMVTFVKQSYTDNGEQKWTFEVLRKMVVHVYTGSLLLLADVDGIVCAIGPDGKSGMTKAIVDTAGLSYAKALKQAKGNKELSEGRVIVSDAGEMGKQKILHAVIVDPIYRAGHKNLTRLDNINTQILHIANRLGIHRLALPLLGTSRLQERFEVEQCSLQLVDNVIELCLSFGRGMKMKELHLVNQNHVMTQYLTQALRTRSHTKLRVEAESATPSRTDVLSQAEAIRGNPNMKSKQEGFSIDNTNKKTDEEKATDGSLHTKQNVERSDLDALTTDLDTLAPLHCDVVEETIEHDTSALNTGLKPDKEKHGDQNSLMHPGPPEKLPYLSKHNLERHDRILRDAWTHHEDETVELEETTVKSDKQASIVGGEKGKVTVKPTLEGMKMNSYEALETKTDFTKRPKLKRRVIQRSMDSVYKKTKEESYTMLHERKQNYTQRKWRRPVVKAKSSEDVNNEDFLSENILDVFKKERQKLQRGRSHRDNEKSNSVKERHYDSAQRYFTRGTLERYKPPKQFLHKSTTKPQEPCARHSRNPTSLKDNSKAKRNTIDKEREDLYMKDMDYLAREVEEHHRKIEEESTESLADDVTLDISISKSEKSRHQRQERFQTLTSQTKIRERESKSRINKAPNRRQRIPALSFPKNKAYSHIESKIFSKPTHENRPGPVSNHFVNKTERYRQLEASLKPRKSKFDYTSDLRKNVPIKPTQARRVLSHSEICRNSQGYYLPHPYGAEPKHYSLDANIHLPRYSQPSIHERKEVMTGDRDKDTIIPLKHIANDNRSLSTVEEQNLKTDTGHENQSLKTNGDDILKELKTSTTKAATGEFANNMSDHQQKSVNKENHSGQHALDDSIGNVFDAKADGESIYTGHGNTDHEPVDGESKPLPESPNALETPRINPIQPTTYTKPAKSRVSMRKTYRTYTIAPPKSNKSSQKIIGGGSKTTTITEKGPQAENKPTSKQNVGNTKMANPAYPIDRQRGVPRTEIDASLPVNQGDLSVRDQIKLEIGLVEQKEKTIDGNQIEEEKKKIKRFWEVVGGKDVNDESLYTSVNSSPKDKILVAKVTKERVMSGKSRSSKKSKISTVHNVGGNYNLTLEVN